MTNRSKPRLSKPKVESPLKLFQKKQEMAFAVYQHLLDTDAPYLRDILQGVGYSVELEDL